MNILKKIGSFIWWVVEAVIIVYVICVTCFILCRNKFGFTQLGSYTMIPIKEETAKYVKDGAAGNLLVVKTTHDLEVGDLIYYYITVNEEYIVKSGVIKNITEGEEVSLYVLDDEKKTNVASPRVIGKYANQYPTYGLIFSILVSRIGFLFLVLLPVMIVFVYQVYEFIMVLKYEKVENAKTPKKTEEIEEL